MTRKDDKGDQPSGGETTWTNTGATRYGRGQHKTGSFGDDILRPSSNHGTQRLPNDDDDAGFLSGRCLGRRCRVSLEQLGALCGGCACQTWEKRKQKKYYICIMYWRMTLALMRCEFCCCWHFSFIIFFSVFSFLFYSDVSLWELIHFII